MLPKSCYFQLRQLRVVRRSLPSNILRTLLQAFITCRLDYCNSLLVGLPACDASRLQYCQNAAGRLFGGISRYDAVEHVLRDKLNWLPIVQIIKFKVRLFGYKAINGLAPPYLKDFFVPVSSISSLSRNQSAARGDFTISSATKNITYRRRSFAVAEPRLWNSLPFEIHSFSSLPMFRSRLKNFLFSEAYTISAS